VGLRRYKTASMELLVYKDIMTRGPSFAFLLQTKQQSLQQPLLLLLLLLLLLCVFFPFSFLALTACISGRFQSARFNLSTFHFSFPRQGPYILPGPGQRSG
jgi:hypothetical protein